MGTSKDKLIERINDLKIQLKEAKEYKFGKTTYIHETHHLYCSDGEMHFGYGDPDDEKRLIYNTDQLFKDLPFIINQVVKENKKMQDYYLEQIITELKEIKDEKEIKN